jgi:hypothetical protein
LEGRISNEILVDPSVVRLPDGRYRICGNEVADGTARRVYSLISSDGLTFTREAGYRIVGDAGHDAFAPIVVALPNDSTGCT